MGKFFGKFLGAIIGGGCTCWAVIMQKNYAEEQRQIDEIAGIRPYIVAVRHSCVKLGGEIHRSFFIQNIGLISACDIVVYATNPDWGDEEKIIDNGKYCLTVNSSVEVHPKYNFDETTNSEFHYTDLKSNLYYQEFRYDKSTKSFISLEPKKIRNLQNAD